MNVKLMQTNDSEDSTQLEFKLCKEGVKEKRKEEYL
jgi:hypothetical protein